MTRESPKRVRSRGDFYGTTYAGGTGVLFNGTVFKMTPAGLLTTLVEFTSRISSNIRGNRPQAHLVQGRDGDFYGTTYASNLAGDGTVFKMTPTGVLTTLVEFTGDGVTNKGSYPSAGLVLGNDGNFYGPTYSGGANNYGTVFKMTPAGTLTTYAEFTGKGGSNRGRSPDAELVQGSDGNFFGTTYSGGASDYRSACRLAYSVSRETRL